MADAKAAGKKAPVIIIKKIKKGGHGAHGGAWKVAYADFVTAMMCFFLVMWLMGSDEETKAAIAQYFNQPQMPWSLNTNPDSLDPSKGDSILKGQNGMAPEEMVQAPVPPVTPAATGPAGKEYEEIAELVKELLGDRAYAMDLRFDSLRFSVPESLLFTEDQTALGAQAPATLAKLGRLFQSYGGNVTIEVHSDPAQLHPGNFSSPWEFTLARAVSVMNFMTDSHWVTENRIRPLGSAGRHPITLSNDDPATRAKNRRVEFTLSHDPLK